MCGIFAARSVEDRLSRAFVHRALIRLANRGPDGEGAWISDDGRTALGHRRLSIISPENGLQPIVNEDGSVVATVNGEFYGFESLRRDLQQRGHRFRTLSDSEVVVHLYEDHGTDCLRFLRGEFAFVLWDAENERLFAARDRFGVKPLCYAEDSRGLFLASKAKALFAAGIQPAWDRESFSHVSAMQYVLPDRTLFANVRQVPPGCYLLADSNKIDTRRYWDLDFPASESGGPEVNEADLVEQCRHQVMEAIGLRLRADVPTCCQLSGGLDSSSVVCAASEILSQPVDAFTISFDVDGYDEMLQAQEVARSREARLHVVRVSQADLLTHLDAAVAASEGLAINGHLTAKFLLHRAIRDAGFKVVLTGEGADEVFLGYGHQRLDYWRAHGESDRLEALAASNQTSLGMMLPHGSSLPLGRVQNRLGFVPAYLEAKATLGWRVRSLMREDSLGDFRDRDPFDELVRSAVGTGQLEGRHPVYQSTWLWTKTALASYILATLGDGTEMPFSVEGRVPFLDHRLFEFLRRVPVGMKIRGQTEKHILREAMRPVVPEVVRQREKHPLDAPPLSLFGTERGQAALHERLRDESLDRQPFFCPEKCGRLLHRLPTLDRQERQAWDPVLMTVLSTQAMQNFLEDEVKGVA